MKYLRSAAIVLLAIILITVFTIGINTIGKLNSGNFSINMSNQTVIKQLRSLNRWETASFTIEKVIDAGTTNNNAILNFLYGDRILLIAHGEVIGGFDLSTVSNNDVKIDEKTIHIQLPAPRVLITRLDNKETRIYDRTRGLLAPSNKDLESQARQAAEQALHDSACKGNILKTASDNARQQLTSMLKSLGFTTVTIDIPIGSC